MDIFGSVAKSFLYNICSTSAIKNKYYRIWAIISMGFIRLIRYKEEGITAHKKMKNGVWCGIFAIKLHLKIRTSSSVGTNLLL